MNALDAVKACSLVYDDSSFRQIANLLNCDSFESFEDADTCVLYARNINTQYLIFRGTFSKPGVILDLDFIPTQFAEFPGKVHRGFGLGWRDFDKWFKDRFEKDVTMYAAGHSLGGAFATLAGMRYPIEHTYTFGCPRVGDSTFASNYPCYYSADGKASFKRQTRYVHDLDPVPNVPIIPFVHVVDATRIGCGNWFSAIWQHLIFGFGRTFRSALDDHRIENYSEALEKLNAV